MTSPDDPWGGWPLDISTSEEATAARRADRAAAKARESASAARKAELDAVAVSAQMEVPVRTRKQLTEDAQRKIRRDLERDKNVSESQRNLRAITALRMRKNGADNRQIAKALGYKSPNSVTALIGDALRNHVYDQHEIEVYRDFFLAELIQQGEIALETIRNPGYLYDVKGELVQGPDGEFLANISERTKAQTEFRHMQESARKLLGIDAPQKKIRKNTIIIRNIREAAEQLGIVVDDETGMDIVDADIIEQLPPAREHATARDATETPGEEPGDETADEVDAGESAADGR